MKIPTILKGDDAGAITLALDSSHSYDGATLVVAYQGATKTFTGLAAGGTVSLVYNHVETAAFRLGCYPMEARLIGAGGSVETVSNAEWRIKVTDIVSEVNCGGSFAVVPGAASVPVTDIEELGGHYKLADVAAKLDEVCRILAQRTAPVSGPSAGPFGTVALALLFSLGAFAANVQTARLDDMYNDERVVTNVTFEGLATPGAVSNIVTKAYVEDLGITADFSTNNTELVETIHQTEIDPTVPAWAKKELSDMYANFLYQLLNRDFFAKDANINAPRKIYLTDASSSVTVGNGPTGSSYPYSVLRRNRFEVYGEDYNHVAHYRQEGVKVWPWWDDEAEDYAIFLFPTNSNGGTFALTSDIPGETSNIVTKAYVEGLGISSEETDPTIGLTNGTIYVKGSTITPLTSYAESDPTISAWAKAANKPTYTAAEVGATTPADVTAAIREQSLGGIWDETLQVWWTPRMRNGSLTYEATTNVNLNAEN